MTRVTAASEDLGPVEALAEEFLARRRAGERPTVEEYADRHPELADRIRAFFPALGRVEDLKPATGDLTGSLAGAAVPGRGGPLERLGDYRILREVGRGGMGVVYEAEQESLGRRVALKVLAAAALLEPKQVLRFEREAKAAARLHHTNIVPVFGVGECEGVHYYVMQFIQGLGLDEVLDEVKRLRGEPRAVGRAAEVAQSLLTGTFTQPSEKPESPDALSPTRQRGWTVSLAGASGSGRGETGSSSHLVEQTQAAYPRAVARLGVQVAEALEYAHAQGVLHRDVKPSNLLLDSHGTVWITDFGLAKATDSADLTHTGDIVGTVRYMAPERFQGRCDARSDVYALGLTLYELLTLTPAFDAADRLTLIDRIAHREPPRLRGLDPRIPRDLETIVMKAIDKDPCRRYPSAEHLAADLRRFLADEPIRARRVGPAERLVRWARRNPVVATLTAAVVLVAIAGFLGVLGQWQVAVVNEQRANDQRDEARALNEQLQRTLYAAKLNLVQSAWEAKNVRRADELLDQVRPGPGERDLRGWEWHFLHRQLHPERADADDGLTILPMTIPMPRRFNFVSRLALSPDGDRVAAQGPAADGGYDLKVWNVADGREVFAASVPGAGPGQYTSYIALSRDGRRVAATAGPESVEGGIPSEVKVWDLTAGRELTAVRRLAANAGRAMTISPDGTHLALATGPVENKAGVQVVEAATGRKVWTVDGLNGVYSPLTYSPDGRRLVVCTLDREVVFKDVLSRRPTPSLRGVVKLFDAATGRELLAIPGGEASTDLGNSVVAFSPDGRRLAVATPGVGKIDVWDVDTGQKLLTFDGIDFVADMAYSPDGRRLAAVGRAESGPASLPGALIREGKCRMKVWDADTGRELLTVPTRLGGPLNRPRLAFRPDGHKLIVAGTRADSRAAVEVFDATPRPDPPAAPGR